MRFVLVPGGWQGGWVYDEVAGELRAAGHQVDAVTLAGLGPEGPADPDRPANLDTHITQVVELVERGEQPVVLCGHSYAGLVIAGAADRLGDLVERLVFIDAYVPDDGDSCWSLTTEVFREMFVAGSRSDGRWVAVPEGVDPRGRAHPLPSLLQSVRLTGNTTAQRMYISGGAWPSSPFVELTERLRGDNDWQVHEIPVGHNIARRDPLALAAVLLSSLS